MLNRKRRKVDNEDSKWEPPHWKVLLIIYFRFNLIFFCFFKEHWENILAMRITNKHLEPRGCDTIGDTIDDEKVFIFF